MKNIILFMLCCATLACGCSTGMSDAPAPKGDQSGNAAGAPNENPDPFYYSHDIGSLEGCNNARSTDTTKVQLRGPSCDPDGSVCYDFSGSKVEVWQTKEADNGPFGSATFVEVEPCQ
jgi:hypothetical protein